MIRAVAVTAAVLAIAAWYVTQRRRVVRARAYARQATERWEGEGGAIPSSADTANR